MAEKSIPVPSVDIVGVHKVFAGINAVNNVNLSIASGEFFSLLGPSGCGKTTLLRMLAGFETPSAGRIFIEGEDVTHDPPERRRTNMVFQSYALFPHLDVRANVAYGLRSERLDRQEIRRRVDEALAQVQLSSLHARRPDALSGGQRQRVALARAMVKRPKVLLLDEPLAALDKRLREDMQSELRNLQRQIGITFVFVTHDQSEAFAMSDRIAVMERGEVLQVAAPNELYRQPACREVASFVGSITMVPGRVLNADGRNLQVDGGPLGLVNASAQRTGIQVGSMVTLGIRPEQVSVQTSLPIEEHAGVEGHIVSATYLGDRTYIKIAVNGMGSALLASVSSAGAMLELAIGLPVWVQLSSHISAIQADQSTPHAA